MFVQMHRRPPCCPPVRARPSRAARRAAAERCCWCPSRRCLPCCAAACWACTWTGQRAWPAGLVSRRTSELLLQVLPCCRAAAVAGATAAAAAAAAAVAAAAAAAVATSVAVAAAAAAAVAAAATPVWTCLPAAARRASLFGPRPCSAPTGTCILDRYPFCFLPAARCASAWAPASAASRSGARGRSCTRRAPCSTKGGSPVRAAPGQGCLRLAAAFSASSPARSCQWLCLGRQLRRRGRLRSGCRSFDRRLLLPRRMGSSAQVLVPLSVVRGVNGHPHP